MTDFLMPSLGADMEAAILTQWFVKPGDHVKRGAVVASVETAKGIIDIEIFADGIIEALVVEPGAEVPVGAALARYRALGDTPPAPEPKAPAAPLAAPQPLRPPPATSHVAEGARVSASPAARRRASELGIDIATVRTRTGGPISLRDVESAATRPIADMRAVIAESMSRSKREIPHYYLATPIDLTRALAWLETFNRAHPVTERLLYIVLLIKAVARALERFPELNGFWREDRFEQAGEINIGSATRLRLGGLIAPALLEANKQTLPELMRQLQDLVRRARSGGLRSSELASATVTVSSLGEGSVDTVLPIIHPPQVAIVGFGAVSLRPWCMAGAIVAAPVITATLGADHRASDGHRGSDFLLYVAEQLQHPEDL